MPETATAIQTSPKATAPKIVRPEALFDRMQHIHDELARRAFEIFEHNGGSLGHELDNWFKAESELLHPCQIGISEKDGVLSVEAEVPGFAAGDLQVSLEPRRLTISGKKESSTEEKKAKTVYEERRSSELLRVVDLPADVDSSKASAELKNGVLTVTAPKVQQPEAAKVEVKAAAK